jgi:folate-binding protein YgfZ
MVADVRVFAMAAPGVAATDDAKVDSLLVDAPPRAAAGWADMVRKFVNPRLAAYRDESQALCDFGVFGAQARHAVDRALGVGAAALGALPLYGHVTADAEGALVTIARVPDLEVEGFELFVPAEAAPALWRRLADAGGVTPGGLTAWEVARVEAGRPEWGVDMDDNTIPQEANFDELHAISYTKGCYVGQETVARVHFRGHVNRHLRGLRFEVPAAADAVVGAPAPAARPDDIELPPLRAPLFDDSGKAVGDVRTAALSPRFGPVAIAMVRRELAVGDSVVARWGGAAEGDGGDPRAVAGVARELRATVTALPFGR